MRIWLVFVAVGMLVLLGCGGTTKIAYMSTGDAIYVMNVDGTDRTRITTDKYLSGMNVMAQRSRICWSRDNKRVAFLSNRTIPSSLVIVDIDGSNETAINLGTIPGFDPQKTAGLSHLMQQCWHPKSDKILIGYTPQGINCKEGTIEPRIYELNLDEKIAKLVKEDDVGGGCLVPSAMFSPQGNQIAFDGHIKDIAAPWLNWFHIASLSGVVENLGAAVGQCQEWSPNGEKLLCNDRTGSSLFTINTDGTEEVTIGIEPFDSQYTIDSASWSPDGNKVLFTLYDWYDSETEGCTMYTVNVDGTEQSKLLNDPNSCFGVYSNP